MVIGEMNASRDLTVTLTIRDVSGQDHDIPAIIDTGFGGSLSLPNLLTDALKLPQIERRTVILGDGTERELPVYQATILWDGQERVITIYEAEGFPLVGVALLYGMVGTVHFSDGGPLVLFRP